MLARTLAFALLVVTFGVALASHPGSQSLYEILGFTADGKYVHFKKTNVAPPHASHWHAVYDIATAKSKTSQPVYRDCGGVQCYEGAEIDKKTGERTTAQLTKTYGAPVAASLVPMTTKIDKDAAIVAVKKAAGYTQVFAGPGVEVKTTSKLLGTLADLSDGNSKSVQVEVEVAVTASSAKWTTKHKLYADSVVDLHNGNILLWPELYVQQLAVAPDRKAIALVFARKPYVIKP